MQKVLIDTDVVLDFFFERQPFCDAAAQVFSLCELKRIHGYITPVIFSNVYYLLGQTAPHQKVVTKLNQLLLITDILIIDKNVLLTALASKFNDLEDAIQHYAALKAKNIDVILTRNIKDYKKSEIGVLTPEHYINGYF
jgi:predicted nucleic acid-binding protein